MDSEIKVFGDGIVTITLGLKGLRLYVGIHEVKYIKSCKFEYDDKLKSNSLEVEFHSTQNREELVLIENNIRLASSVQYIKVRY